MSPPSSPEDKNSKPSCQRSQPPTGENPFVKFKRFTDSQISNVLNGIIGLPSVFKASQTSSSCRRLDEKMKKRDEGLGEKSVLTRSRGDKDKSSTDPPASESNQWSTVESEVDEWEWKIDADIHAGSCFADIPLYSTMEELAEKEIMLIEDGIPELWGNLSGDTTTTHMNMNLMRSVICGKQHQISNSHDRSSLLDSSPQKSLLPYLMYSPYSPLRLTHLRRLQPADSEGIPEDEFSYCDGFEDLLLASRGLPMRTWSLQISSPHDRFLFEPGDILYPALRFIKPMWRSREESNQYHRANIGFSWIRDALQGSGLFWEAPQPPLPREDLQDAKKLRENEETEDGPETEQDMYNRFLHLATSPFQKPPLLKSDVESAFEEMVDMIFDELTPPKERPSENSTSAQSTTCKSVSKCSQTDDTPNFPPSFPLPLAILLSLGSDPSPTSSDSNIPVSRSTTDSTPPSDSKMPVSRSVTNSTSSPKANVPFSMESTQETRVLPNGITWEVNVSRKQYPDGRVVSRRTETTRDGDKIVQSVTTDEEGHVWDQHWSYGVPTKAECYDRNTTDARRAEIKRASKANEGNSGWFWDGRR